MPVAPGAAFDEVNQVPDGHSSLDGVTELFFTAEDVPVATADAQSHDYSGPLEVGHDLLDCSFGDSYARRDVPKEYVRLHSQAHQHVPVVGEERPPIPAHAKNDRAIGFGRAGL